MRRIAHALAVTGLSAASLGLLALPAAGHVTVQPPTAAKGGYATLTFKVPNERDEASTTKLEIEFPEAYPFAGVSVRPKDGWDYTVERTNLPTPISNHGEQVTSRVAKITWTADSTASQIAPGEFDEFPVSAGPLPADATSMTFKALQTYSNGEIVRWIEEAAEGAAEPRFPAPKLALTDAGSSGTSVTAAPAPGDVSAAVAEAKAAAEEARKALSELNAGNTSNVSNAAADAPTKNQVNTAVGLAIGAIVLALIGAGIGGAALSRRPKEEEAPPPPPAPTSPPPAF